MLSEILKASVEARGRIPRPDRQPGLSCSSLFPCPYRLYLVHIGKAWEEPLTAQQLMNLEDGWDQEEQSVRRLGEAGIKIENRQAKVSVGKSEIPGRIDGTVTLDEKYLWEHKAWGSPRYDWFVSRGIDAYLGEKAQVNAYMLGMGLKKCIFYLKRKEDNDCFDTIVQLDSDFILPIIEWADRIRLDGWVPQPELTEVCSQCEVGCFGQVLDFSWIKTASAAEMAEKWRTGDRYVKIGEMLKEEARTFFVGSRDGSVKGLIGDKDLLIVEGLRIQKVVQHRFDVSKEAVVREFGPEGLMRVGEEKDIIQYRIKEEWNE